MKKSQRDADEQSSSREPCPTGDASAVVHEGQSAAVQGVVLELPEGGQSLQNTNDQRTRIAIFPRHIAVGDEPLKNLIADCGEPVGRLRNPLIR